VQLNNLIKLIKKLEIGVL